MATMQRRQSPVFIILVLGRADAEKLVLQRIANGGSEAPAERPPLRALMLVALASGIPFVGFGFLDNVIMVRGGLMPLVHARADLLAASGWDC
jgi:hypothetical protein